MSNNTILATAPLTTQNYILKATGTALGNSLIWDNGTNVGIGNTNTSYTLDVSGTIRATTSAYFGTTSGNIGLGTTTIDTSGGLYTCVTVDSATYSRYSLQSSGVAKGRFQFDATNVSLGSQATGGKLQLFTSAAYAMEFLTNDTLRMTITSAGNVGIGTSSPNRLLDVSSGGDTYLRVAGNRGNADDLHVANVEFYNSNSTRIISEVRAITGTGGTQSNSGQLAFYTNNAGTYAERMRITSVGQVQVKQAADTHSYGFSLINSAGNAWNMVTGGDNQLYFGLAGTSRGVFATNGVYTAISDKNKKKDFEASTIGLNEVLQLKPTLYRMKDEKDTKKHLGFIAQEVKEFIPQAYSESVNGENTFIGLTEMPIIAAIVKAIQDMNTKLDEQNQTIQNLQEQINILAK